jgi:hypothetical protein
MRVDGKEVGSFCDNCGEDRMRALNVLPTLPDDWTWYVMFHRKADNRLVYIKQTECQLWELDLKMPDWASAVWLYCGRIPPHFLKRIPERSSEGSGCDTSHPSELCWMYHKIVMSEIRDHMQSMAWTIEGSNGGGFHTVVDSVQVAVQCAREAKAALSTPAHLPSVLVDLVMSYCTGADLVVHADQLDAAKGALVVAQSKYLEAIVRTPRQPRLDWMQDWELELERVSCPPPASAAAAVVVSPERVGQKRKRS